MGPIRLRGSKRKERLLYSGARGRLCQVQALDARQFGVGDGRGFIGGALAGGVRAVRPGGVRDDAAVMPVRAIVVWAPRGWWGRAKDRKTARRYTFRLIKLGLLQPEWERLDRLLGGDGGGDRLARGPIGD